MRTKLEDPATPYEGDPTSSDLKDCQRKLVSYLIFAIVNIRGSSCLNNPIISVLSSSLAIAGGWDGSPSTNKIAYSDILRYFVKWSLRICKYNIWKHLG